MLNKTVSESTEARAAGYTIAPVFVGSSTGVMPEWGRWRDVQSLFGIKRGTLWNLVAEGKVKSISMRRKGNKFGCRLFYLPGISQYLHALLEAQNSSVPQPHSSDLALEGVAQPSGSSNIN